MKKLPALPPEPKLTILKANNCALEGIDPSFIRTGIKLNLSYNKIETLPKDEMVSFLEAGGKLHGTWHKKSIMNFDYNPLKFVPQFIYIKGEEATLKFFKNFSPDEMVRPDQNAAMLVGDSGEGKTSLGLSLKEGSPQAEKVSEEDRTEAFDNYVIELDVKSESDKIDVNLTDIGGQDDYNLVLPTLSRNHGLFLLVVSCLNVSSKPDETFFSKI